MEKRKVERPNKKKWLFGIFLLCMLFTVSYHMDMSVCQAQEQCTAEFKAGEQVTLTATPCPGCKFVKWTCDVAPCPCEGQGKVCKFIMPERSVKINAEFKKLVRPTWRRNM